MIVYLYAAPRVYTVVKYMHDRWGEVRDPTRELVCVTVYKRGAVEVVRRLAAWIEGRPAAAVAK